MDFDELDFLRRNDPAWRLLRADNAPLVLGFLRKVFVDDNVRSISATDLISRLDDELYALNERLGEGSFPKTAKAYLDDWVERAAEADGAAAERRIRTESRAIADGSVAVLPPAADQPLPDKLYVAVDGTGVPMVPAATQGRAGKHPEGQWVGEPNPTSEHLEVLLPDEASLYTDLVEGVLGRSVRLEQERISYAAIEQAAQQYL